jgi:V8-like Glu-specific endopeptidase
VIYGDDNRLDLYQVQDQHLLSLADSTVALVFMTDITTNGSTATLSTTPFRTSFRYPLCETERFAEQDTVAFCSGFLVAPNIVLTAGHCVQNQGNPNSDCNTTRFVFGFNVPTEGYRPLQISTSEIYSCKHLIKYKQDSSGADFSVVELDRPVTNHRPLKMRLTGDPAVNDELTVIGHPSGLPVKVAGGAILRSLNNGFIRASLDTYGGNSGSAVFNSSTYEVEGILVRGEIDFVLKDNKCMESKVCGQNDCRGEDVTRISEVLPFLPAN